MKPRIPHSSLKERFFGKALRKPHKLSASARKSPAKVEEGVSPPHSIATKKPKPKPTPRPSQSGPAVQEHIPVQASQPTGINDSAVGNADSATKDSEHHSNSSPNPHNANHVTLEARRRRNENTFTIRCLADVQPEQHQWLWRDHLLIGALNLITGDPNLGKSTLVSSIAARVTTGEPWPDGTANEIGNVMYLSLEDSTATTVKPRFLAERGNITRVHIIDPPRNGRGVQLSRLGDVAKLRRDCERFNIRLLVLDPLSSVLAGVNTVSDAAIRFALYRLIKMAEQLSFAVVGIAHLNKTAGRNPMYRSHGSIAYQALARMSWIVVRDPNGEANARQMLPVKHNIVARPHGIAFHVVGTTSEPPVGIIKYGDCNLTVDAAEVLSGSPKPVDGARERAVAWLKTLFETNGFIATKELEVMANEHGISWKAIERFHHEAGIKSFKVGTGWGYRKIKTPNP